MADPGVPLNVLQAAKQGDAGVVQEWLENGGDANLDVSPEALPESRCFGTRLLSAAAEYKRLDVIRVLLANGADINYVHRYPHPTDIREPPAECTDTALSLALESGDHDTVLLLLQNGAGPIPVPPGALLNHNLLRAFLSARADLDAGSCRGGQTLEAYARSRHAYFASNTSPEFFTQDRAFKETYAKSLAMLEGTRLAGSYKGYVLAPFKELLRLRSLLARERARISDKTPEVVARLFGGRTGGDGRARPPTRRHRPPPNRAPGVPDAVFWKVMEYWRSEDWRRPFTRKGGRWCAHRCVALR